MLTEEPRKVVAIILAGGKGERFGSEVTKPFLSLNGKPVIDYSLDVIAPLVDDVIVVSPKPYKNYKWAAPGALRQQSVESGLNACPEDTKYVIIHDAARPFITTEMIQRMIRYLMIGVPSLCTAVQITDGYAEGCHIESKANRFLTQTPEGFDFRVLKRAYTRISHVDNIFDGDAHLLWKVEGILPFMVPGIPLNSKITFPKDLDNAEGILRYNNAPITTSPNLKNKRFLLFGGTGGIGSSCKRIIEESGGLVDSPRRPNYDLCAPWNYHRLKFEDYAGIVHAAGVYTTDTRPCTMFEINTGSCYHLMLMALEQKWQGNMVFLSSAAATYGRKGIAMYSASKAALNSLIESMHDELAETGIFVNAIAPAKVDTKLQSTINPGADPAQMLKPDFVAGYVARYLDTKEHGHIIYLRNGI
jgi:2-C-methyl-D-erythritol 4-phosphate cytidylyltransferase